METDKALMKAIEKKDSKAFQLLAERYMDRVYFFICRQIGNRTEAEDIMQDVFMKIWQQPQLWDSEKGAFRAWLWTMAANKCLDKQRTQKFYHSDEALNNVIDFAPLPDKRAEDNSALDFVRKAIEQLPERQKEALYLSTYDELSHKEIASVMAISPKAVESLLSRARQTLRQATHISSTPPTSKKKEAAYVC
jgi:RNA polymerase sigma-70 factor (ECF subfamily)